MKYFSLFLGIYLSLLIAAPAAVQLFPCIGEQACENICDKKTDDKTNSQESCPFCICCSTSLFITSEQKNINYTIPSASLEKITAPDESCCSDYSSDCWHPPELRLRNNV
jgi:hypothetical protein